MPYSHIVLCCPLFLLPPTWGSCFGKDYLGALLLKVLSFKQALPAILIHSVFENCCLRAVGGLSGDKSFPYGSMPRSIILLQFLRDSSIFLFPKDLLSIHRRRSFCVSYTLLIMRMDKVEVFAFEVVWELTLCDLFLIHLHKQLYILCPPSLHSQLIKGLKKLILD